MKMLRAILTLSILSSSTLLFAAEPNSPLSVSAQATYGSYSRSTERSELFSQAVTVAYSADQFGASVTPRNWNLKRINGLGNLNGVDLNVSTYLRTQKSSNSAQVGITAAGTYLTGNDNNTKNKFIPYLALTCSTPGEQLYFDIGYANMTYHDANTNQYSAGFGIALFDRYVWSQTRFFYNRLTALTQGKSQTYAFEERITWYALPDLLSFSLFGMAGQRVYGYDPDLAIAYTLPDIQNGGAGFTVNWNITRQFSMFGDVTWGSYEKRSISNSYSGTYGTLGLKYIF